MKTQSKTLILLAVVAVISLVAWQNTKETEVATARLLAVTTYQTSLTRTSTVGKMCGTTARTSLYNQADIDAASSYIAKVNADLGIDGYSSTYSATNSS
jgi:hypothetical protein